jgi:beta-lactam-binding protein with PASTA domain
MLARPISAPIELSRAVEPAQDGLMPDLRGLSARDAVRALMKIGMTARMTGDGFVLEQTPAAGSTLAPGAACALRLGRRPTPTTPAGAPQ